MGNTVMALALRRHALPVKNAMRDANLSKAQSIVFLSVKPAIANVVQNDVARIKYVHTEIAISPVKSGMATAIPHLNPGSIYVGRVIHPNW